MHKQSFLFILIIFFSFIKVNAQQDLILNDGMYIVINGGQVVLENSKPNAIKVLGNGGNIISEGEDHVLNWKVKEDTGVYTIPFATSNLIEIPLQLEIKEAGINGEGISFSTYGTLENNMPIPNTTSTPINCFRENNTLAVVDRFWRIETNNYTVAPRAKLLITYDDVYEIEGDNNINESNLKAMYFNPLVQQWESETNFRGTADALNKQVKEIAIEPQKFYKNWMLIDSASIFSELCS